MVTSASYWLGFLLCILTHEAGHIVMARVLGLRVKRIGLTWRGPYIQRERGVPVVNAIVSAAGPLINLVGGAVMWRSWHWFAIFSLVLGVANLVPTKNSDGRRILGELGLIRMIKPRIEPIAVADTN